MAIDTNQTTEKSKTPDAPFRTGVDGKYKLLIKGVISKLRGYEYELVDGEGKEYKAEHPKHYAEGELLRCMVGFKVSNAKLEVTDTQICNKQDLAVPLPEEKKAEPKSQEMPKTKTVDDPRPIDDPRKAGKSGLFYLRVVDCKKEGKKNVYWVVDSTGHKYQVEAHTKRSYVIGKVVVCNVYVANVAESGITVRVLAVSKRQSTDPKPKKRKVKHAKRTHSSSSSSDWLGTPYVGTRFRLIYTPMGNKR